LILYALITVMVLLWSGNFVVAKIALREFPPLLLMGIRTIIASLLILPLYLFQNHAPLRKADLPRLLGLGMFGVALNQLFFVIGMSRTTVAHSALTLGLTPVLVLLIAGALRMERITLQKVAGMATAIAGVAILQWTQTGTPSLLGDFFIFLASLTFALFTVMGKRSATRFDAITVNTAAYVGSAIALLPVTIWQAQTTPLRGISWTAWACLFYMAAFASVLCYQIYYYAIKRLTPSRVSSFSYLQPLLASLMAVLWLGESLTVPLVAGGSVIFAGVLIAERG
jgi:drug/metabolite transporter (DMT)-like permease